MRKLDRAPTTAVEVKGGDVAPREEGAAVKRIREGRATGGVDVAAVADSANEFNALGACDKESCVGLPRAMHAHMGESQSCGVASGAGCGQTNPSQWLKDALSMLEANGDCVWPEVLRSLLGAQVKLSIGPKAGLLPTAVPLLRCMRVWRIIWELPQSAPFQRPIDHTVVPEYLDVVRRPMCLLTVWRRLANGFYEMSLELASGGMCEEEEEEEDRGEDGGEEAGGGEQPSTAVDAGSCQGAGAAGFAHDMDLVWTNCVDYNGRDHSLSVTAFAMRNLFDDLFR